MNKKNHKCLIENFDAFDSCFYNQRLLFLNIPKNASSSIRSSLNIKNRAALSKIPNKSNLKTIVVFRNPYERVISIFKEVIKLRKDGFWRETLDSEWFKLKNHDIEKSFRMFLDYIENRMYDAHIYPQSNWFNAKKINLNDIDFLILFENLNDDFNNMCEKLNLKRKLKRISGAKFKVPINKSKVDILKNLVKSDSKIRKKIENIYSEDITLYNQVLALRNK